MYALKRLLIALDLTEMDDTLIKYASHLAKDLQSEKVYFFHIAKDFNLPEDVKKDYPDLVAPTDEALQKHIEGLIEDNWESGYGIETVIELKEGNPSKELLKWIDNKQIDLIVMGRKKHLSGDGVMPDKITNLAHASVLLVPEKVSYSLKKIVLPVDFSENSKLAAEQALSLVGDEHAKLKLLHIFHVPSGYHKTGKSYEEVAFIMQNIAKRDFDKFLEENDLQLPEACKMILDDDSSPSDKIFEYAEEVKADMIVMGSKGRTGMASILFGSVASKIIGYDTTIPLLVVKEKEENMGFLQALLNI